MIAQSWVRLVALAGRFRNSLVLAAIAAYSTLEHAGSNFSPTFFTLSI